MLGAFVASAARSPASPACSTPPASARVDAAAGTGIELAVVSAVVVGGVAIFGGAGTVYGAALGALLLATIRSALVILQVNPFWEQAINGALLLLAIGLDGCLAARSARELRKRSARTVSADAAHAPGALGDGHRRRCWSRRSSTARSSSPDFLTGGNLNSILVGHRRDRAHRAAADLDHRRRARSTCRSPRSSASRAP